MLSVLKLSVTLNILLFSLNVFSQESPSVKAFMTDSPVTVDGYLNEASWQESPVFSDFIQFEPDEGKASARKTEVRMLFGKDDLYSYEQNWYQIWANLNYKIKAGKSFGSFQRGDISLFYTRRYSFLELYDMGSNVNLSTILTTKKFRQLKFGSKFFDLLGGYDLWETRGLGIWAKPISVEISGEFNTDERKNWKITPKATIRKYNNKGSEYIIEFQSIVNTGTRLSFQANIKGNWEDYKTAWASNETFMFDSGTWMIGSSSTSPDNLDYTEFTAFDDKGMLGKILTDVKEYIPGRYYVPVFGTRDTAMAKRLR